MLHFLFYRLRCQSYFEVIQIIDFVDISIVSPPLTSD